MKRPGVNFTAVATPNRNPPRASLFLANWSNPKTTIEKMNMLTCEVSRFVATATAIIARGMAQYPVVGPSLAPPERNQEVLLPHTRKYS